MSDDALLVWLAYGFIDFVTSALSGPIGKVAIPSVVAVAGLVFLNYLHSRRSGYLFRMEQEALARIGATAAAEKEATKVWIKHYLEQALAPELDRISTEMTISTNAVLKSVSGLGAKFTAYVELKQATPDASSASSIVLTGLPENSALYGDECALDKSGNPASPEGPAVFEWKYNREGTETDLVSKTKEPTTWHVPPGSSVSGYIDTNHCSSSVQLGQHADSGFYTAPGATSYLQLHGDAGIGFALTPNSTTPTSEATNTTTEKEST